MCALRDAKGLYRRHAAGKLTGLTGIDDPYEVPESPDLRIETQHEPVETSVKALHDLLIEQGLAT